MIRLYPLTARLSTGIFNYQSELDDELEPLSYEELSELEELHDELESSLEELQREEDELSSLEDERQDDELSSEDDERQDEVLSSTVLERLEDVSTSTDFDSVLTGASHRVSRSSTNDAFSVTTSGIDSMVV